METVFNPFTSKQDFLITKASEKIETLFHPFFPDRSIEREVSEELRTILRKLLQKDTTDYHEAAAKNVTILLSDIRGFTSLVEEIAQGSMLTCHLISNALLPHQWHPLYIKAPFLI